MKKQFVVMIYRSMKIVRTIEGVKKTDKKIPDTEIPI